jgi:hypothetical protein
MTPLVVDMPEEEAALSLLSMNGDACARSGSNNAPTALATFMIAIDDLKGDVKGTRNRNQICRSYSS